MTATTLPAVWALTVFADAYNGQLYRAIKCNPKNIKSAGMDGKTWNVPWVRVREATAEEKERFAAWERTQAKPAPLSTDMFLRIGNVVKFRQPTNAGQHGIFVVIKSTPNGWSLVTLGGDIQSRYFRGVPDSFLEKVETGSYEIKNV